MWLVLCVPCLEDSVVLGAWRSGPAGDPGAAQTPALSQLNAPHWLAQATVRLVKLVLDQCAWVGLWVCSSPALTRGL